MRKSLLDMCITIFHIFSFLKEEFRSGKDYQVIEYASLLAD